MKVEESCILNCLQRNNISWLQQSHTLGKGVWGGGGGSNGGNGKGIHRKIMHRKWPGLPFQKVVSVTIIHSTSERK